MDLTTIAMALLVAVGLLGADTVMYSNSVIVEVAEPPKFDKVIIDQGTLEGEFEDQLFAIAKVPSVVLPPELRASRDQGLGMAIAQEVKLQNLAYTLQSELGYKPDRLRLALYVENGSLRGLVSGNSYKQGSFHQVMIPLKDETLDAFVHRCAIWGASQLAPYSTALFLLRKHSGDKDFTDVVDLIEHTKAKLPPAPVSFERSILTNLLGVVALFGEDVKAAGERFNQAVTDYPSDTVATLNAAFVDLQIDNDKRAAERMEKLLKEAPPANSVLLATAYETWAAAEMSLNNLAHADQLLAMAVHAYPGSSTALDLWGELKALQGDPKAAAELKTKAMQSSADFENYAEVAALYFQLAWQNNHPITRSKFVNPTVVTFH